MKQVFKSYDTEMELQGKPVKVTIKVETDFDQVSIDDLCDSTAYPEDAKKLERDLDSGNASAIVVIVRALSCGEEGTDILGSCVVYQPQDIEDTVKEYNMVENAVTELKETIVNKYNLLKTILS